mgnify:CR=1 FL=1
MAVYVDDYRCTYKEMIMCHMVADTHNELIGMVLYIGVHPKWIQCEGTYREHFDLCLSKREKAVKAGAIQISVRELGKFILAKRGGKQ